MLFAVYFVQYNNILNPENMVEFSIEDNFQVCSNTRITSNCIACFLSINFLIHNMFIKYLLI